VLRSIKELEFDRAMGKVSEADFEEIGGRLRARAIALMEELDRPDAPARPPSPPPRRRDERLKCANCGTVNEPDARFCKQCGRALDHARA
jgi:zinc-ribbon domain